jgi:hypothetical protein
MFNIHIRKVDDGISKPWCVIKNHPKRITDLYTENAYFICFVK